MKISDNLKIMTLPKIFSLKITILLFFFLVYLVGMGLIHARPTLALVPCPENWCNIMVCIFDEGCVEPGGVMQCTDGYKECIDGRWVPTDKTEDTPDLIHYTISGISGSSLEKFQEVLKGCAEQGTTAQECFVGGAEQMQSGAASGIMTNTINAITTMLIGPVNPEYAQQAPTGAINTVGNLIAGMYANPPASSVEYFADLGRNLGIAQPAYAQGIGFEGLRPILPIWKVFRNIAYLFFVVVFVIIGFAIMFRLKIDPQTVIGIQNALPKVIVALILVTFSYAIAGLLIDLIYVFISLILAILRPTGADINISQNVFQVASNIFTGGIRGIATNLGSQINNLVADLFSGLGGRILGFGVGLLATAVIAIAIAFSLFKLFFSLLISYISIIVGVIFSPLMLMLEALPGQKGLSSWLKMMLSNIIVFPVTAGIFTIAGWLTKGTAEWAQTGGQIWVAPFLGTGTTDAYIPTLIGAGMILLAPSIVDMVKKAIGAPGLAEGLGAPLAVGARVPYVAGEEIYRKLTEKRRLLKEARAKLDAEAEIRKRMQEEKR